MLDKNPFSNLKLNFWYKLMLLASLLLFFAGLLVEIQVIGNLSAILLGAGGMFFSFGEWINHPIQVMVRADGMLKGNPRKPCLLGSLFNILGFIIMVLGLYQAYKFINLL